MATHPEPTRPTGRHASLFIFDDFIDYEADHDDPRVSQTIYDAEAEVRAATGLTPNQFRSIERTTSRLAVAAACSCWATWRSASSSPPSAEALSMPSSPAFKLIILGCSATKRENPEPMPAIDRYDGPMWRTLRARLSALPTAQQALASGALRVMAMSARYGFIPADLVIPDYDIRMTPALATKMARDPSFDFQLIADLVKSAEAVLFAGGEVYRDAMWRASGASLWNLMKITETDGGGIGLHRAQLGEWLDQHFGSAPTDIVRAAA